MNMAAGGAVCGNGSPPPLFSLRVLSRARGHQRSALVAAVERPKSARIAAESVRTRSAEKAAVLGRAAVVWSCHVRLTP